MDISNEVDEAMDEEKYEIRNTSASLDYYKSGSSSSSNHSDNESEDFKTPPKVIFFYLIIHWYDMC